MSVMHGDARAAYRSNTVATASSGQLLVMLFERLVLDCERGLRALMKSDHQEANTQFQHAQAIVTELQSTLEVDGMPAGRELLALYAYLQKRLIVANVQHHQRAAKEALLLARDLCDTWRTAAHLAAQTAHR